MRYFIESVNTLSTTGKSRKGATMQAVALRFEHITLDGSEALNVFVAYLRGLVEACNATFTGKPVMLHHNAGSHYIYAANDNNGHEAHIFSISYAPVEDEMPFYQVAEAMMQSTYNICGQAFAETVQELAKSHIREQEGGEA